MINRKKMENIPQASVIVSAQAAQQQVFWDEFSKKVSTAITQAAFKKNAVYCRVFVDDVYQNMLTDMLEELQRLGYIATSVWDSRDCYIKIEW
jgi:hypothetical protein